MVFWLIVGQRWRSFYYCIAWGVSEYISANIKMFYHAPRPYWLSTLIMVRKCEVGYGDPSGHAVIAVGRPVLWWLDYNESCKEGKLANIYVKIVFLLFGITIGVCVCYSRLINGLHSLDQVIFGALLGLWLDFTLHYCFREGLRQHIYDLTNLEYTKERVTNALIAMLAYIVVVVTSFSVYFLEITFTVYNQLWQQIIVDHCGPIHWQGFFISTSFIKTGAINTLFGAYFGMHLQMWWLDGLKLYQNPKRRWQLKMAARFFVAGVCFGPFYALAWIPLIQGNEFANALLWFIPLFSTFFILFSVPDYFCFKLGLYDKANIGLEADDLSESTTQLVYENRADVSMFWPSNN
jgi:hypothetical protein